MSDKKLKEDVVKLAYNNPELRDDLLPLLSDDRNDKEAQQHKYAGDVPNSVAETAKKQLSRNFMMYEPEIMIAEDVLNLKQGSNVEVLIYSWDFGRIKEAAWERKGETVRLKLDVDIECSVQADHNGFAEGELKGSIQMKDYVTSVRLD